MLDRGWAVEGRDTRCSHACDTSQALACDVMVKLARSRSVSRELGPTPSSNSPGSTTRRPAASTIEQALAGTSMRVVTDSPAGTVTRRKALSSLAAHVTLVTTSVT